MFGRTEASGFPRAKSGQEAWLCHGWDPARLKRIVVCEDEGQIAEISVSVPEKSQVSISLPQDVNAALPQMTLAGVAERITDQLDAFPYVMGTLDGEGYWLDSFAWHFISKSEGVPYAIIEVTGVEQWGKDAHRKTSRVRLSCSPCSNREGSSDRVVRQTGERHRVPMPS